VLSVSDTGPGIHPEVLPRLFEPFVTRKPAGSGLGLGLVISAQLVRAMDGTLHAANLAGGGACFVVDLPAAMAADPLSLPSSPSFLSPLHNRSDPP